jgi:hypothetical protein
VLKCVQDFDGESSLPTTVLVFGRISRQCLEAEDEEGKDGVNTETGLKVDSPAEQCGPGLFSPKNQSFKLSKSIF